MIWFLLIATAATLIVLKNRNDRIAVVVYLIFNCIHALMDLAIPSLSAYIYYLSAAVSDVGIMMILLMLPIKTAINLRISIVCVGFIYLNLLGWLLYEAYYSPVIYNYMCYLLYIVAIIGIYRGRFDELGIDRDNCGRPSFFNNYHAGHRNFKENHK